MNTSSNQGVQFTLTNEENRGRLATYHHKPSHRDISKCHQIDIANLPKKDKRNTIANGSKFTIGMEVEKVEFHRDAVKEYEIFCGFEYDGSCGVEAVTNILPLLPPSPWRTKVFDMMFKAQPIIDERFSPSNGSCGGHMTIGIDGMSGEEIRKIMRKNCGVIWSLYRHRLNKKSANGTQYCGHNQRMEGRWDTARHHNGWHNKYQAALVKDICLEFRIVSKFESVKQMMRRYEMFYIIVDFSVNNPNGTLAQLLKLLKPIIVSMYNGDMAKVEDVMTMSKDFTAFILHGKISAKIKKYVSPR
jgi:hypothetical protein